MSTTLVIKSFAGWQSEHNPLRWLIYKRETQALQRYEGWACAQFDQVVTVTNADQVTLSNMLAEKDEEHRAVKFTRIPICVDTQEVQPVTPKTDTYHVFHLGTMFYLPNITGMLWFVREVWPRILSQVPQATMTIAGKNPPPEIEALSFQQGSERSTPLRPRCAGRKGTGTRAARLFIKSGSEANGRKLYLAQAGYKTDLLSIFETKPGGGAWDQTALDNLEVGVELTD